MLTSTYFPTESPSSFAKSVVVSCSCSCSSCSSPEVFAANPRVGIVVVFLRLLLTLIASHFTSSSSLLLLLLLVIKKLLLKLFVLLRNISSCCRGAKVEGDEDEAKAVRSALATEETTRVNDAIKCLIGVVLDVTNIILFFL